MTGLWLWAKAFAFTQLVEVPIYRAGLRCSFWRAFGASAITHPLVWLAVVSSGWRAPWSVRATCGETFAVVVEAIWFAAPVGGVAFGARRGATWSLAANATSFLLGLLAFRLFG